MKKIAILGAGESGVGAALLAKAQGYEVFVSEKGTIADRYRQILIENEVPYEEHQHTRERLFEASQIVKSPGIPDHIPLIRELRAANIPVISEIEFAYQHTTARIIAITGSNGKTTTTNLTYHLLQTAGKQVDIGGNVGPSFARLLTEKQPDYYVLELSSFQLDGIRDFRPQIAVLLNITPDHLDRYDYKLDRYAASKWRITENQTADDLLIYNADDDNIRKQLEEKGSQARLEAIPMGAAATGEVQVNGHRFECSLKGPHNEFNATCAVRVALELGVAPEAIQQGLDTFKSVPHRLEPVATIDNIEFINDSKATNVDAVYFALLAMDRPVIWIAGGTDKGNDYGPLKELVDERVNAIICLGVDNEKIKAAFAGMRIPIDEVRSARDAVEMAYRYAEPGDAVLLSPACASFDLFRNYEDRGEQFREAVNSLKAGNR